MKLSYRPEIDSLRFLSVFSVVFLHLDLHIFKGGFLGVDIFFVISGYLITNIILTEIQKKSFSISSFYMRRARRIIPALLFLIFFSFMYFDQNFLKQI